MWWLFIMNDDVHFFSLKKIFFPILQKTIHDNDDEFCKDFLRLKKKQNWKQQQKKLLNTHTHTHTYYYRLLLLETFPLKKKIFLNQHHRYNFHWFIILYPVFFFIIANLHTNKKKTRKKQKQKNSLARLSKTKQKKQIHFNNHHYILYTWMKKN